MKTKKTIIWSSAKVTRHLRLKAFLASWTLNRATKLEAKTTLQIQLHQQMLDSLHLQLEEARESQQSALLRLQEMQDSKEYHQKQALTS